MVYQGSVIARAPRVKRLFKCIQNEVRGHRGADAPADNTASEHVDHEGHIQPALPRRKWSKRRGVVELFPRLSSPNRTCTSQRIRNSDELVGHHIVVPEFIVILVDAACLPIGLPVWTDDEI